MGGSRRVIGAHVLELITSKIIPFEVRKLRAFFIHMAPRGKEEFRPPMIVMGSVSIIIS